MKENYEKEPDKITRIQLLETILNHLTIGIAIVSPQLDILEANDQFYQIIKSSQTSSAQQNVTNSFWEQANVVGYLTGCFANADHDTIKDFEWLQEDGSVKYIRINAQSIQDQKMTAEKILFTFSDVSEIKQSDKVHDKSVRHMMHELRNPLSNISLCVELLADSTKDNNQEDTDLFLSKAAISVQRMKQLINDLSTVRKSA